MNGKFVISLDFEKYWGMRDHASLLEYKDNLENVDEVVIRLLDLFHKYNIHATWGIVGFLFHEDKKELVRKTPQSMQLYTDETLNPYPYIKNEELDSKFHFARNIIDEISNRESQEIASHTYSHYYCLESGQTIIDFERDLELFISVYKEQNKNKDELSTIIFPRNQVNKEYISVLTKHGLSAYRGIENHFIYNTYSESFDSILKKGLRFADRYINITGQNTYSLDEDCEIYNVKSSRFLASYSKQLKVLEPLRKRRIKNAMTHAAKNNEVFHLWWHPHNFSSNISDNINFLDDILKHFVYLEKEYNMQSNNIKELVKVLN